VYPNDAHELPGLSADGLISGRCKDTGKKQLAFGEYWTCIPTAHTSCRGCEQMSLLQVTKLTNLNSLIKQTHFSFVTVPLALLPATAAASQSSTMPPPRGRAADGTPAAVGRPLGGRGSPSMAARTAAAACGRPPAVLRDVRIRTGGGDAALAALAPLLLEGRRTEDRGAGGGGGGVGPLVGDNEEGGGARRCVGGQGAAAGTGGSPCRAVRAVSDGRGVGFHLHIRVGVVVDIVSGRRRSVCGGGATAAVDAATGGAVAVAAGDARVDRVCGSCRCRRHLCHCGGQWAPASRSPPARGGRRPPNLTESGSVCGGRRGSCLRARRRPAPQLTQTPPLCAQ